MFDETETADMAEESGSLYIGRAPGDQGVVGAIDEVAVWRRALTAAEIASLYP